MHQQETFASAADQQRPTSQTRPGEKRHRRPQIWVGSLTDFNAGVLYGTWLDAARNLSEVRADIEALLSTSPTANDRGASATGWAIFDSDGFGALQVAESDDLSWVTKVARGVAEQGPAFAAYANIVRAEDELGHFYEDYLGHFDSLDAHVEQLVRDRGYESALDEALPPELRPYVQIDIDTLAQDSLLSGDIHCIDADGGGVWVFRGR